VKGEVEGHVLGGSSSRAPCAGVEFHGRYRDRNLPHLLKKIMPHVVWFPARVPETYSYTLSAALAAGAPIAATDLGSFPERLGGRAWTWLLPWDSTPERWFRLFGEVRDHLVRGAAPAPPEPKQSASRGFYPESYLSVPAAAKR
jgi:hypothetical protein